MPMCMLEKLWFCTCIYICFRMCLGFGMKVFFNAHVFVYLYVLCLGLYMWMCIWLKYTYGYWNQSTCIQLLFCKIQVQILTFWLPWPCWPHSLSSLGFIVKPVWWWSKVGACYKSNFWVYYLLSLLFYQSFQILKRSILHGAALEFIYFSLSEILDCTMVGFTTTLGFTTKPGFTEQGPGLYLFIFFPGTFF